MPDTDTAATVVNHKAKLETEITYLDRKIWYTQRSIDIMQDELEDLVTKCERVAAELEEFDG